MAVLNSVLPIFGALAPTVVAPNMMWHLLILNSFSFIADYGWRIVVFTILLKLVLSPLDFYQRYKLNKNQKITERLKPTMEKLQKQYAGDQQKFSQAQMELNRKEGYSYFSSCLPMILTMVVFITLWLSMQTIARYMTFKEYVTMYDEYTLAYNQCIEEGKSEEDSKAIAQDVVYTMYYDGIDGEYVEKVKKDNSLTDFELESADKVQASFLWVQNIWAPDIPWGNRAILDHSTFLTSVGDYAQSTKNGLADADSVHIVSEETYNNVMGKLLAEPKTRTNGYLVLPILVVLLSVGSQLLSSYQQKKAGQTNNKGGVATSMKVMMFVMPVMMGFFAVQYASIFTIYMVTNSATTLAFNGLFTGIIKLIDKRKKTRHYGISVGSTRGAIRTSGDPAIIHYVKGANPHAGEREAVVSKTAAASDKTEDKKSKSKTKVAVKRDGRPDPHELMGIDMSDTSDKKK